MFYFVWGGGLLLISSLPFLCFWEWYPALCGLFVDFGWMMMRLAGVMAVLHVWWSLSGCIYCFLVLLSFLFLFSPFFYFFGPFAY